MFWLIGQWIKSASGCYFLSERMATWRCQVRSRNRLKKKLPTCWRITKVAFFESQNRGTRRYKLKTLIAVWYLKTEECFITELDAEILPTSSKSVTIVCLERAFTCLSCPCFLPSFHPALPASGRCAHCHGGGASTAPTTGQTSVLTNCRHSQFLCDKKSNQKTLFTKYFSYFKEFYKTKA